MLFKKVLVSETLHPGSIGASFFAFLLLLRSESVFVCASFYCILIRVFFFLPVCHLHPVRTNRIE